MVCDNTIMANIIYTVFSPFVPLSQKYLRLGNLQTIEIDFLHLGGLIKIQTPDTSRCDGCYVLTGEKWRTEQIHSHKSLPGGSNPVCENPKLMAWSSPPSKH